MKGKDFMKKNKMISTWLAAILWITAAVPGTINAAEENAKTNSTAVADQGAAEVKNKNEVVYAKLAADGNIDAVYVVNHFEVEKGGSITDYGDYKSVQNLTKSQPIIQNEDEVSFQADEGNFYYQGNQKARDLPWVVKISYELDGTGILPQDLAGKSGELGIHIQTKQNPAVDPAFFTHYMMQITLTLASDKSSEISAPGATVAYAGKNTVLSYTVLPKNNADFWVKADMNDFSMSGIELSAVPFSMSLELPDMDGMLEDLNKLPEAIADLNDGVGKLSEGTNALKKGADGLKDGSLEFKNGLSELKKNSSQITSASSQIKEALATISAALKGSDGADMGDLTQLPPALKELSQGLKGISGGLNDLKDGYALAYSALDTTMQNIPKDAITQEMIRAEFSDANDSQRQLLNRLYASYMAGQAVKGAYSQVKPAFASVAPALENVTVNLGRISGALDGISDKMNGSMSSTDITAQLEQLSKGLSELSGQYTKFDQGLREYMKGVGKMSDGYDTFNTGISEFADGVGSLSNGISDLHDGTARLEDETSQMPDRIQEEIDKLTEDYRGTDFEAVSFVSSKNKNVGLVQFVLRCEEIKLPKIRETEELVAADQDETVWDRFVALFKRD
jgi:X-X-X-Leu-X-X-Gly heptad repeat protein